MVKQIKAIDPEKYSELLDIEGDTVPLYFVSALHFNPPRAMTAREAERRADSVDDDDDNPPPAGMQEEYHYIPALLLNVDEACFHKEIDGSTTFILPADVEKIEYDMVSAIHGEHNAWAYRIEPRWWDAYDQEQEDSESPMDAAIWIFKPNEQKPWEGMGDSNH